MRALRLLKHISIPSGTIKSRVQRRGGQFQKLFQFLLVRLKEVILSIRVVKPPTFQFLLVRLKECIMLLNKSSIFNFNSFWYD